MIELSDPCTCEKIRKPDLTYFCPDCWRTPKGEECHNKKLLSVDVANVNVPLNESGPTKNTVIATAEVRPTD